MKHTKGPWTLVDKTICDADGDSVIEVFSGLTADLKLAAAAPEMFQLLEKVLSLIEVDASAGQTYDSYTVASGIAAKIDRLISNVRGET